MSKADTKRETTRESPWDGQGDWGSLHVNMADISWSALKTRNQTQTVLSYVFVICLMIFISKCTDFQINLILVLLSMKRSKLSIWSAFQYVHAGNKRANVAFIKHDIITQSVHIRSLSAETSGFNTICLNLLPLFPFGLDNHSILKPVVPSLDITTCTWTCTNPSDTPACLAAAHPHIMPFRIIALWANSS